MSLNVAKHRINDVLRVKSDAKASNLERERNPRFVCLSYST